MSDLTFILAILASLAGASAIAQEGAWPSPRQNPRLTNVQTVPGGMDTAPSVRASVPALSHEAKAKMVAPGDIALAVSGGALHAFDGEGAKLWEAHPEGLNFLRVVEAGEISGARRDGSEGKVYREALLYAGRPGWPHGAIVLVALEDGRVLWRHDVEANSYYWTARVGDYVAATPGQEIVVLMQGLNIDPHHGYIELFAFGEDRRIPAPRWRYDFDKETNYPNLLQPDLDGDGKRELAVITHSQIWTFEPGTGELLQYLEWDVSPANRRSFGLTRFLDLNGDGCEDLLVIGNFAVHHEVLLNKGGQLEVAWVHGWEDNVTTSSIKTIWPEPPQVDVDGDGRLEIVLSMWDAEEKERWQVRVYDALTGDLKYTALDYIAAATFALGSDGCAKILANAVGRDPEAASEGACVLAVRDGALAELWREAPGRAIADAEDAAIVLGDKAYDLGQDAQGGFTLTPKAAANPPSAYVRVPQMAGPSLPTDYQGRWLAAADLLGQGRSELAVWAPSRPSGEAVYEGPYRQRGSEPATSPVHMGRVLALGKDGLEEAGRFRSTCQPIIADANGDGRNELVACRVHWEATPTVEALRLEAEQDRTVCWSTQLPEPITGGKIQHRAAALAAGHFTSKSHKDVYLFAGLPQPRSVMLDGRTGKVLWERTKFEDIGRWAAPTHHEPAVYDVDGDGLDDLVFTCPDYYCALDGATGETLIEPVWPPDIFAQRSPGLYTMTVLLEREGQEPLVCLSGGHYFLAVMTLHAEPLWHHIPSQGEARYGREGFLPLPSGEWLIGVPQCDGRFVCRNVSDGSVRWEIDLAAAGYDVATGDVDGDGRFEFVFGTSHGDLYAIGDAEGQPRPLWRKRFDCAVGPPILADLDGDGLSEIAAVTAAGEVLVLGKGSPGAG